MSTPARSTSAQAGPSLPATRSSANFSLPTGYKSCIVGNREVFVPAHMLPDLEKAIIAERYLSETKLDPYEGPQPHNGANCLYIGGGDVEIPCDPPLSTREALTSHAEVLALQKQAGLSYIEAARQLYMAELVKIEVETRAQMSFEKLRDSL
ncbi:hypothetical protein C0991_003445 [Blastosporella zonata]|nr:hypothetical protein C0991_003445 [Blastosporella zonata]